MVIVRFKIKGTSNSKFEFIQTKHSDRNEMC